MFNICCWHTPVQDRTPFNELVKLVERTIRSENCRSPNRPIYLVAESLGACLAFSIAARNPDIDLVLVLSIPGNPFRMLKDNVVKKGLLPQTIEELSQDLATMSTYLPVLADILPRETLRWKLNLLKSGSACANSCLQAVKALMLILCRSLNSGI